MQINEIWTPERTLNGVQGNNKKRLLEFLSKFIQQDQPQLEAKEILTKLQARERLGSTGVGKGVALPHCRIEGLTSTLGTFIKLKDKIDFEALDNQPVDLIFLLLVPLEADKDHLNTLANLAEAFNNADLRKQLRLAETSAEMFNLITHFSPAIPT